MTATTASSHRLRDYLAKPTRGILGLVEEFLDMANDQGLQLAWVGNQCRIRLHDGKEEAIEPSIRKSVLRAALARIAVLCNERQPNAVSPYGGEGVILLAEGAQVIRVRFVNTADEECLELTPLASKGASPRYVIRLADQAARRFPDLRATASVAGNLEEFTHRYDELVRVVGNPRTALVVGRSLDSSRHYREWQWHFLYVRYVVFPSKGCGWIYHLEINPASWANQPASASSAAPPSTVPGETPSRHRDTG